MLGLLHVKKRLNMAAVLVIQSFQMLKQFGLPIRTYDSKCWDNRYGCTVVLEALKAVKDETLPNTLIAGANVQEEVGLRGTGPSVTKFNPDLFFAVDCSAADDISGSKETFGHLDQGFLLRILDPGMVTLPRMKEFLEDTALTHNIPFQYFVLRVEQMLEKHT